MTIKNSFQDENIQFYFLRTKIKNRYIYKNEKIYITKKKGLSHGMHNPNKRTYIVLKGKILSKCKLHSQMLKLPFLPLKTKQRIVQLHPLKDD